MGVQLSPTRFIAIVTSILTLYSAARVGVLFFEALAVVRNGRNEDYELLELCQRGDARGSAKMREACLKARADLASPIVFKAIVHAVSTAFKDFSDTVGSPLKLLVCVLFVISSVMLPIVPWCRALFGQHVPDVHPMNGVHYISYAEPPRSHRPRQGFRTRVGGAFKRLKLRRGPTIEEVGDEEEADGEGHTSVSIHGDDGFTCTKPVNGWMNVNLLGGPSARPESPGQNGRNHEKFE